MDFEKHIQQEYLREAREILTEAEQLFLDLEANPNDPTLIDTIFRMLHTLKGSAFSVGLTEFGRLAHRLENVLDLVRNHSLNIDATIVSLALEVNDIQKHWLSALFHDEHFVPDISAINERLDAILQPLMPKQEAASGPAFGFFEDEPQGTGPRMQILLVDDDIDQMDLYKAMLKTVHCEIHVAGHGYEALEVLARHSVDVIITDLEMPKMNGIELIHRIRAAENHTPIIFVSGFADRQAMIEIINSGANGFLEKPVQDQALLAQLRAAYKEKFLQDKVAHLTHLNFKAYLASSQLARTSKTDKKRVELEQHLNAVLDEIIDLQNELLRPKMLSQVP